MFFGSMWGKSGTFNEADKKIWRPEGNTAIICSGFLYSISHTTLFSYVSIILFDSTWSKDLTWQRRHLHKKYDESWRSNHKLLDFFSKINLCFLKEERKIVKHVLFLIQIYFHLKIFNENSFPSVAIHPGDTFPQNMCLHIQNLSLKKTTLFLIPKPRHFLNNKRTSSLQKHKLYSPKSYFFSHWLENIVMKKS